MTDRVRLVLPSRCYRVLDLGIGVCGSRILGVRTWLTLAGRFAGDDPVLAAAGIGDGSGLAAVRVLGTLGALMGTRFSASNQAASEWLRLPDQALRPE